MAAQEYFNMSAAANGSQPQSHSPAPRPQPAPQPAPTPAVHVPPNPPYPMYDGPPPPYSPGGLRLDSAASQSRPQSHNFPPEKQNGHRLSQQVPSPALSQPRPVANGSGNGHIARPSISQSQQEYESQFRPPVRQQHSYNYPPEKPYTAQGQPPYGPHQQHPQQFHNGHQPVQSPYQNGHPDRRHNVSFATGRPQQRHSSRSRSRTRSRSRSRDRDRGSARSTTQKKKSSGLNTFLGAGGGAILGDAIFPGLGTIGGALLGGFGGHEYDKNKKRTRSHEPRTRERRYSDDYDYRSSRR